MQASVDIALAESGWGVASLADIREVLLSAARQFPAPAGGVRNPSIFVFHRDAGPITLDQRRSEDGRVQIGLATKDTYWSQYAFQFAHEWGHVLTGHCHPTKWQNTEGHVIGWLEESLCETASLFALRAMSREWAERPPYPNWRDYAASLMRYADDRMREPAHMLPDGQTFARWLTEKMPELRVCATRRNDNTIIAKQLLPVFEADPQTWQTLPYFRQSRYGSEVSLEQHMVGWQEACPPALRHHLDKLRKALGTP